MYNHTMWFPSREVWLIGNLLWKIWLLISQPCAISGGGPEERTLCYCESTKRRQSCSTGEVVNTIVQYYTTWRQINNMVLNNCMSSVCVKKTRENGNAFFCYNCTASILVKKFRHSFIMTMHDDIKARIVRINFLNRHCDVQSSQIIYSGLNLI